MRKLQLPPCGYLQVNALVNGKNKCFKVHRMVAELFVPGVADGLQVNHKDLNKLNNASNNLEWVTAKENMQHARRLRVFGQPRHPVIAIPLDGGPERRFASQLHAAKAIGGRQGNIWASINKENRTAYGFKWREE
jgi:hypothetical protein